MALSSYLLVVSDPEQEDALVGRSVVRGDDARRVPRAPGRRS